jgi:hypothetical protein
MQFDDETPSILGKTVLVGIATFDSSGTELSRGQWWGRIITFNPRDGLLVDIRGSGERHAFPPLRDALRPAPPGVYELRSSGECITNPDFLYTLHGGALSEVAPPHQSPQYPMPRHEHWRLQYRQRRYIEHLSDDELRQRAADVFCVYMELTDNAKIAPWPIRDGGECWLILWTHVLEEFSLRFGPYPNGFQKGSFDNAPFPDPRSSLAAPGAAVVRQLSGLKSPYLVKYGKYEHLHRMITRGEVRISPAALYADPSLNPALRDDELALFIQPNPREFRMDVLDGVTRKYKGRIHAVDNKLFRRSQSNYYVYCLSKRLAPRLFVDFRADACVVIQDPKRFEAAVIAAMNEALPDWIGNGEAVMYLDPLNSTLDDLDVFTRKHFRFAYQREYRLVWLPRSNVKYGVQALQPVFLSLNDLADYCSVHRLENQ